MIKKVLTYLLIGAIVSFVGFYAYIKLSAPGEGDKAPNFSTELVDGTPFQLSDLEGEYVLLDFWGSWCGPCRRQNKELVRFYKDHKLEITIVSIALEKNDDNWKRASEMDGLVWKHQIVEVTNMVFMSDIAQKYGVDAIPTKLLISPEGILLGEKSFDEIVDIISD